MKKDILSLFAIALSTLALFYPLFQGKIPFPADALLGLYHPWRDVVWDGFVTGVPYRNFLTTDPVRQTYPWRELAIELWKSGEVPLWNPYSFTGTPLLANVQSAVFYPLNALFFVGSFPAMWGVLILLTPLLASSFFYLWMRGHVSVLPALFGAVAFALSGFMMGWMTWGTIGHAGLWLPLMLLALDKMTDSTKRRWRVVYVTASVSSLLAGHLQTALYVQVISSLYAYMILGSLKKSCILSMTCLLLAGVQLAPTAEFILHSARTQDLSGVEGFLPYKHLVMFLVPDFFGNPATGNYWGEWNYLEFNGYVGIIPLWFALHALFFVRNKIVRFFCIASLASLVLATKNPLSSFLAPLFAAAPSRLLFVTDVSLAVLASFGAQKYLTSKEQIFKALLVIGSLFIVLLSYVGASTALHAPWTSNSRVILRNSIVPVSIFAIVMLVTIGRSKMPARFLPILLTVLLALTLLESARSFHKFTPFSKNSWVYPETRVLKTIKQDPGLFRIMATDRRIFPPNVSVAYGIESVEGYDPLYLAQYAYYIARSEQGREDNLSLAFRRIITPQRTDIDLLNRLNVKYVLSLSELADERFELQAQEGETRLYKVNYFFPRVSIDRGKTQIFHYSPGRLRVGVETPSPATLLVRDPNTFGWNVTIDTVRHTMQLVDGWFRAVSVPAGEHIVTFMYWPIGMTIGILVSAAGIVVFEWILWKNIV